MSYCVPMKDLKDTASLSKLVKKTDHPIFITKGGREEFVVMSTEVFHEKTSQKYLDVCRQSFYEMIDRSEKDIEDGRYMDAHIFLEEMKEKYAD